MKRTISAAVLVSASMMVLVSLLVVQGCDNPTGSDDGGSDGTETMELAGLYAGYWEVTDSTAGSVVGEINTVFTMEITESAASIEVLGPSGLYTSEVEIDMSNGAFSLSKSFATPDVLTVTMSGSIAEGGTVLAEGSIDYDSDGTVDDTVTIHGEKNTTGHVAKGTVRLPEGSQGVGTPGKPFFVAADSDGDGGNGGQVSVFGGVAGDSLDFCYVLLGVPTGDWEIYGALYLNAPSQDNPERAPEETEYSGVFLNGLGVSGVSISGSGETYDFTMGPDLAAVSELEGTWRVPEDGGGEQLFTFDRAAENSLVALLSWERVASGDSGNSTMVYSEGSSRTAVFYHFDHPDGSQQDTYAKITWTEPVGDPLTTDIAIYENSSSFDAALAEEVVIDVDGSTEPPNYPLPATKE